MHDAVAPRNADPRHVFADLLERHRRIVFKVANSYAWNAEDRADLAQDIAAQLWHAFAGYDPQRPFSTWMYRIALNVAISHARGRSLRDRHTVPLDEAVHDLACDGGVDAETGERARALQQLIARLDGLDRALLLLHLEERSVRDIAEILGLSETNVTTKLSRLRQRLRADLA
jgi:RNA polymerase sigma factor (sigma-70 family)